MRERLVWRILAAVLLLAALIAAALWYARDRGIPLELAATVLPAFLLEAGLYVLSGLGPVRDRLQRLRPPVLAGLLTALAPVSWLLLTIPLGHFDPLGFVAIIAMAAVVSFWYVLLPRGILTDFVFLVMIAAPVLLGVFNQLYPDPAPRLPGQTLGAFMWYRTLLVSLLCIRHMEGINFGFIPAARDWMIGLRNFLWFLPAGLLLALAIGFVRLKDVPWDGRTLILTLLTFVGVLWVLAVAEEFYFRGLLQQQLARLFRSNTAGLLVASAIFGAAHLPYRPFPNWRLAILAAIAGYFYGRAYLQARSIRAAMVTHALVVTTWKMFLVS